MTMQTGKRLDEILLDNCGLGLTRSEVGELIRSGAVSVDGIGMREPASKLDQTQIGELRICGTGEFASLQERWKPKLIWEKV